MKNSDYHDLLDNKIDSLLANQPLKPSAEFTSRVLAAADELNSKPSVLTRVVKKLSHLALPIAALILVAFTLIRFIPAKTDTGNEPTLTHLQMNEIFLLEEGLAGLVQLSDENFSDIDLIGTLDSLIDSTNRS